jgi:uncharacterized protein (DUF2345 family)
MIAVRVRTQNGLVKAAYGERQWLEKGLWEVVDVVDELYSKFETLPTNGQVYADDIYEFTAGHGIVVHHDVVVEDADLTLTNGVISTPRVQALDNSANIRFGPSGGDLICTANDDIILTAGDDIILSATDDITIAVSGTSSDVTISAAGADGDILISATGDIDLSASGAISLIASSANSDIAISALGADGDVLISATDTATVTAANTLTLSATGASGDVTVSAVDNVIITASGADGDITVSAQDDITILSIGRTTVTGTEGIGLETDHGDITVTVGGNANDDTADARVTITFDGPPTAYANKRRVIDLDGFVSQKNNITTASGSNIAPSVIIPNGVETLVPLRSGAETTYAYEALCGPSILPFFSLSFYATFIVQNFTTQSNHSLTLYLNVKEAGEPTTVRLATFTFQPGGNIEVDGAALVVRGLITSAGKDFCTGGDACLSLGNGSHASTTSQSISNTSAILGDGDFAYFYFSATSAHDTDVSVQNLNSSFSLVRSS